MDWGLVLEGCLASESEEKRILSECPGLIAKHCADRVDCLFLAQGAMGRKNPCFSVVENSQKLIPKWIWLPIWFDYGV